MIYTVMAISKRQFTGEMWLTYLLESALDTDGVESLAEIQEWYSTYKPVVNIERISLADCNMWHLNESSGYISHHAGGFFEIAGIRSETSNQLREQPIILQQEIGYLGILTSIIEGKLCFLMQAKIEPGNVNKVQISPTIQATKSNFTQVHGGRQPHYLEYFLNARRHTIIYDQIQSEQSSRFLGKRNRNIIIFVDEPVVVRPEFKWLTLAQLHRLMRIDNMVNMDSRTVLSCLPYSTLLEGEQTKTFPEIDRHPLFTSMSDHPKDLDASLSVARVYQYVNNYKMFSEPRRSLCPLKQLATWHWVGGDSFESERPANFRVIFCRIEIEGRELRHWDQPLFEAAGKALFMLLYRIKDGKMEFLVQAKPEIGAFDHIELAPSIQLEYLERHNDENPCLRYLAFCRDKHPERIMHDVVLSEEGGRFYCEENDNVVLRYDYDSNYELPDESDGYFWVSYQNLNNIGMINNVLNIQLRNLLSLLDFTERYDD